MQRNNQGRSFQASQRQPDSFSDKIPYPKPTKPVMSFHFPSQSIDLLHKHKCYLFKPLLKSPRFLEGFSVIIGGKTAPIYLNVTFSINSISNLITPFLNYGWFTLRMFAV